MSFGRMLMILGLVLSMVEYWRGNAETAMLFAILAFGSGIHDDLSEIKRKLR